jgi:hypothetical protein
MLQGQFFLKGGGPLHYLPAMGFLARKTEQGDEQ